MQYPKPTDNYDIEVFNSNFRELSEGASALDQKMSDEIVRAESAESNIADDLTAEISRAKAAEKENANNVKAESDRAKAQEALKAPIESPTFTGTPKAPTPEESANDLRIATTAFVKAVVNSLIDGAPETLDTLKEIADAIETNRDVMDALNAAIGTKVDKVSGKGLSANDYTTAEKNKLSEIAAGAEVNVQADWNVTDTASDAFIKNKPSMISQAVGTCATAAATAAKVVTTDNPWSLSTGAMINVKFAYTNTAQNPTLNVNGTGAKPIFYGTVVLTTASLSVAGIAGRYIQYVYDGTNYVFTGWSIDSNSTYSPATLGQGYGTCATAAATVAKVATLANYALVVGGIVAIKFTYAVPASATLNINNRGAKAIYYHGTAITAGIITAGDTATFIYNGSQYHLISVDKSNTNVANMTGATASAAGKAGLVPAPAAGRQKSFLCGNGTWEQLQVHYSSTSNQTGWYKIKINSANAWMMSCMVMLYHEYTAIALMISGYNYPTSNAWFMPNAEIMSASKGVSTVNVKFGMDSDNLKWFAIPASNYTGLTICNVNNGYIQIEDFAGKFTIERVDTLSGTEQANVYASAPMLSNTVRYAEKVSSLPSDAASHADTLYLITG